MNISGNQLIYCHLEPIHGVGFVWEDVVKLVSNLAAEDLVEATIED